VEDARLKSGWCLVVVGPDEKSFVGSHCHFHLNSHEFAIFKLRSCRLELLGLALIHFGCEEDASDTTPASIPIVRHT